MNGKLEDYKPEHLDRMKIRFPESEFSSVDEMKALSNMKPSYALVIDDQVICIFGMVTLWEGVAEFWLIPGVLIERYKKTFFKAIKIAHERMMEFNNIQRLQCICFTGNERSRKWIERNGFVVEGIMKKYRHGKDFYRMAKVI